MVGDSRPKRLKHCLAEVAAFVEDDLIELRVCKKGTVLMTYLFSTNFTASASNSRKRRGIWSTEAFSPTY